LVQKLKNLTITTGRILSGEEKEDFPYSMEKNPRKKKKRKFSRCPTKGRVEKMRREEKFPTGEGGRKGRKRNYCQEKHGQILVLRGTQRVGEGTTPY